jgi:hypothetical protein
MVLDVNGGITMVSFLNFIIMFVFVGVLLFGLVQSKKHSFIAGVYSFLLLIINQLYLFISPFITNSIIENFMLNNPETSAITVGEFALLLSFIPQTIQIIAYTILIVGLYKMWNEKSHRHKKDVKLTEA